MKAFYNDNELVLEAIKLGIVENTDNPLIYRITTEGPYRHFSFDNGRIGIGHSPGDLFKFRDWLYTAVLNLEDCG